MKRTICGLIKRMDVAEMAETAAHANVLVPQNHYRSDKKTPQLKVSL
jgi:hypothetical protein